jgi:holo-[acyl-carrier protein] synthase
MTALHRDREDRRTAIGQRTGPMILGIGTDLATSSGSNARSSGSATGFRDRVFTDDRTGQGRAPRRRGGTYAKRWAAKEACSKALGTGLRMGIAWKDMGVVEPAHRPADHASDRLGGRAAGRDDAAGPSRRVHVTLTDDHPWAQAFVVIEAPGPCLTATQLDSARPRAHKRRPRSGRAGRSWRSRADRAAGSSS